MPGDALEALALLLLAQSLPGGLPDPASARRRAARILGRARLPQLLEAGIPELVRRFGLPRQGAERLVAAVALVRAAERSRPPTALAMDTPGRVHELLRPRFRGTEQETFVALLLDARHRLRRVEPVTVGLLTSSLVHPREVFRAAVREAAAALIVAHNHPSGDPEPSREDLAVTRRLTRAGELLGIPVLDHVIVGDPDFVSLRERLGSRWSNPGSIPPEGVVPGPGSSG